MVRCCQRYTGIWAISTYVSIYNLDPSTQISKTWRRRKSTRRLPRHQVGQTHVRLVARALWRPCGRGLISLVGILSGLQNPGIILLPILEASQLHVRYSAL